MKRLFDTLKQFKEQKKHKKEIKKLGGFVDCIHAQSTEIVELRQYVQLDDYAVIDKFLATKTADECPLHNEWQTGLLPRGHISTKHCREKCEHRVPKKGGRTR